jgi:hypothetical protein
VTDVQRGPEILPGTWEYELVAAVVAKAAEYAGRPTNWNGKLYEQPGPISGVYEPDGSMTVSRTHVLDQARSAYTPGDTVTSEQSHAAAGATRMLVFQARLSLTDRGDDSMPGATPIGSLEDLALEGGLADHFARRYTTRIADELAEHPLPTLAHPPAFPAYLAATDRLMYPLSGATGVGPDRLRDLIESTERPQGFNAIADRVLDHELGDLVPDAHRDQLRQELTSPLRRGLGQLTLVEAGQATDPGTKHGRGDGTAEWATLEFEANLDDIKDHYESWAEQNPGTEPPPLPDSLLDTFRDRENQVRQHWAAEGHEQNTQPPPVRDAEIADLQRFLGSYTATSRNGTPRYDPEPRTDNVRPIGSAKSTKPAKREVE